MIEAAKIWNEPNNKSHWDLQLDPDWEKFAELAIAAGKAIRAAHPTLPRVLGGISPIDPFFIGNMKARGVLDHVDAVAVHGFPLDWNLWQIDEWPAKLDEIRHTVTTEYVPVLADLRAAAGGLLPIVWVGIALAVVHQLVGINVIFY